MLRVTGVTKVLGTRRVLDRVSLEVSRGEVAVILGENGAGKSTLLRVVCGMLSADEGDIVVDGVSIRRDETRAKAKIGYVPDATEALPELMVREFIELVWALKGAHIANAAPPDDAAIARLGLRAVWNQAIGSLSFGQRKRMCLLAASCGDPPLVVFDEPSNGLDPEAVTLIERVIADRRATDRATLLTTNDAAFAARIDGRYYRLERGALVST
jgi:ABC-type multidrug transport system ATPase subunit